MAEDARKRETRDREKDAIAGSIAKRSFIFREIPAPLNVVTTSASEIGYPGSLEEMAGQLFGASVRDTLTDDEYKRSLEFLSDSKRREILFYALDNHAYNTFRFWDLGFYHPRGPRSRDEFYDYIRWETRRYVGRLIERLSIPEEKERERPSLIEDFLLWQFTVSESDLDPSVWQRAAWPEPSDSLFLQSFRLALKSPIPHSYVPLAQELARCKLSPQHFVRSLNIRSAASSAHPFAQAALHEVYKHQIPFGQSWNLSIETVEKIKALAKAAILIEVLVDAPHWYLPAYDFLMQGQPYLAVECAAAGTVIIIIKTGTIVAIEHLLLNRIAQTPRHGR